MTLLLRIEDDRVSCRLLGKPDSAEARGHDLLARNGAPTSGAEEALAALSADGFSGGQEVFLILPGRAVHARKLACTVPINGRVAQADVSRAVDALKEESGTLHAATLFHGVCQVACDETAVRGDPVGTACRQLHVESLSLTADLALLRRFERLIEGVGCVLTDVVSPHRALTEVCGTGVHVLVGPRDTIVAAEGDRDLLAAGTIGIGAEHLRRDAAAAGGSLTAAETNGAVKAAIDARLAEWRERLMPLLPADRERPTLSAPSFVAAHFARALDLSAATAPSGPDLLLGAERLLASGRHERTRWTPRIARPGAAWVAWLRDHF